MDPQLRRDPKYQNFVTVFRGFNYVGKALEPYTVAGLQRAHQKAYIACAGLPPCLQQCSRIHGRNTIMWCGTCTAWKNALLQERRRPYNNWENTESWNWSTSYDNIASVFLPTFWNPNDIQLNEFGTACHLWTSCKEFNIGNALLKKLRELRNKHYGHNPDLKIKNVEKTKVFDALKTLVRGQDVQAYVNVGQCIQDLDNIAKGDELTAFIDDIEQRLDNVCLKMDTIDATQKIFAVCVEVCFSKMVRETKIQNQTLGAIRKQIENGGRLLKICVCIFLLAFLICLIWPFVKRRANEGSVMYQQYTECFSETYSYPFPQDFHLLPYFKEHSTLFGRTWLFEDIVPVIEEGGLSEKGILITADMGYGKSAIVKHLLCSHTDERAYKIRKHIAAFHLCRFDVPATKNPQRFIHRLVGFLSTNVPEYGALISSLPESSLLFDDDKCRKEIVACFDQGIWHPLDEMKTIDRSIQLIVIDALDECYDKRSNVNEINDLLMARYERFPKWIKFIITSRIIPHIHTMHNLKHYSLDSGDQRNKADIKQYIEYKASLYPALRTFDGGLDKYLDQSEGLFLFVVHLFDYATTKENEIASELPETLSAVYKMNFKRQFHSVADYEIARSILEIVIASIHPLSKYNVANMLENLNVASKDTVEDHFERISFCFRSFQELTFIHQTLHLWLISSDNNNSFHVSAERGHVMLSRYLLNQMNSSLIDIVDIAIHIGSSHDTTLAKAFSRIYSNKNVTKSTLHKLVWKSNAKSALELILNMQIDVDTLNEGNVTPAFVAAARGHLNQLKFLQSRGADMNFTVYDSYLITSSSQIDVIKHKYYFGYKLIHIAAQFGHFETVSFLLKQNKKLRYVANGLGLTVAEILCENGHEKLLELVSKNKAGFGNCLYYAAKNGHIHIVNRLASLRVNASCISHMDAAKTSEKLRDVDATKSIFSLYPDERHHQPLNLNDLWWVVNQESPLHAAIKSKSAAMTSVLIKQYPHFANCVDAFGMTPFLLSVTENLTNVFEILLDRVTTDTCRNASTVRHPQPDLHETMCPVGGNYAHLDGIYGRYALTNSIHEKGIAIDWLAPDSNSISAAHYAACNGNTLFLMFFKKNVKKSLEDIRSENQSTPYHSAAICGSVDAFNAMTDSFKNLPPELYDIENKTLLHYIVMREFKGRPAHFDDHEQVKSLNFFKKLLKSGMEIGTFDSQKRNILHFALKHGHFYITQYLLSDANALFKELIKQKDIYGSSPVNYALKNIIVSLNVDIPVIINSKCAFFDFFLAHCVSEDQYIQYLSSWEFALVNVMRAATEEVQTDFSNAFKDILLKSPYLTAASLVFLKGKLHLRNMREHFIEGLLSMNTQFLKSMFVVARHSPKLFTVCGKPFSKSPLHQIAYNCTSTMIMENSIFLKIAFGNPINTHALNCADSRGYNSFHYALIGGNIRTAVNLFDIGVSVTNKKVAIKDILWMVLLAGKQYMRLDYADHFSSMDNLMHKMMIKFQNKLVITDVCSRHSHELSLSHLLAVAGLKYTMQVMLERFGKESVLCRNKHNVTSMYLWELFNNQSFKVSVKLPTLHMPEEGTEYLLLASILNDFPWDMFVNGTFKCILNAKHLKLNLIKCFTHVQTGFRNIEYRFNPFYRNNMCILNCLVNGTLHALNNLEDTLFIKHGNISQALLEVKVFAGGFQLQFRLLHLPYNYPRLKQLIVDQFNVSVCERKGQVSIHVHCLQLYKEFDHMLKRVIAYYIREFTFEYISSQNVSNDKVNGNFKFLRQRIKTLNDNLPTFFSMHALPFDRMQFTFSNVHERVLLEHNYLNILRKTAKYQYMKRHVLVKPLHFKHSDFQIFLQSELPEPLNSVKKYFNENKYGHIFDNIH